MNIALDYDETYTRDPEFWGLFISNARRRGHTVYIVTARLDEHVDEVKFAVSKYLMSSFVYNTNLAAKKPFMEEKDIWIDVWIDDNPNAVINGVEFYE